MPVCRFSVKKMQLLQNPVKPKFFPILFRGPLDICFFLPLFLPPYKTLSFEVAHRDEDVVKKISRYSSTSKK